MVASEIRATGRAEYRRNDTVLVTSSRYSAVHRPLGMAYRMALDDLCRHKTDVGRQPVDGLHVRVERRGDGRSW
jgi:hypothetical protein